MTLAFELNSRGRSLVVLCIPGDGKSNAWDTTGSGKMDAFDTTGDGKINGCHSLRRALLMPEVNPESRYRCAQRT